MNRLSILLRIIAIIAASAACILFFISKGKLAEEVLARKAADKATREIQEELTEADNQIENLNTRLKSEQEALSDTKRKLESTRSEMYTARQEVSRTQQQLSIAKNDIKRLEESAKRLRSDLLQAEQSLASASNEIEIENLNLRIAELDESNAKLEESLQNAVSINNSTSQDSEQAVSSNSLSELYSTPSDTAKPVSVFGPETEILSMKNGFIVLSNNANLELVAGAKANMIQKKRAIGSIQVVKTDNDMILANVLPGSNTSAINAGGTVTILP